MDFFHFHFHIRSTMLCWVLPPAIVAITACSSMGDVFQRSITVRVAEARRAEGCGQAGDAPKLRLFADRTAFQTWQSARRSGFPDVLSEELNPGPYALIEYSAGEGTLVVSRQANLRQDGVLTLAGSFLSPPVQSENPAASVCVLMALPDNPTLKTLVLRDQTGSERAHADASTKPDEPVTSSPAEVPPPNAAPGGSAPQIPAALPTPPASDAPSPVPSETSPPAASPTPP